MILRAEGSSYRVGTMEHAQDRLFQGVSMLRTKNLNCLIALSELIPLLFSGVSEFRSDLARYDECKVKIGQGSQRYVAPINR